MKKIFSTTLLLVLTSSLIIYGWGDKGHKTIAAFAMKLLPSEMKFTDQFKSEITDHSVDPDNRKRDDKSEGPKHFIDIDYYKEFTDGIVIMSRDSLNNLYDEKVVTKEGILPWATEETFFRLIKAFKEKNKDNVLLYASDLAHYVGDGHQPLHATVNYDGQLTLQKGIHSRYEIKMVDNYLSIIEDNFEEHKPFYIKNVQDCIFGYIVEANDYVEMLLSADNYASGKTGGKFDKEYYRLLWFKTKYVTINEINSAALCLSSLIYTAWVEAGKPVMEY